MAGGSKVSGGPDPKKRKRQELVGDHVLNEIRTVAVTDIVRWPETQEIPMKRFRLSAKEFKYPDITKLNDELKANDMEPVCDIEGETRTLIDFKESPVQVFEPESGKHEEADADMDFGTFLSGSYTFVDKSRAIHYLCAFLLGTNKCLPKSVLICRPPGFGKTFTLSMFEYFFSRNVEYKFNPFVDMLIADSKFMSEKGNYHVLHFDLKMITCKSDEYRERLQEYCASIISKQGETIDRSLNPYDFQDAVLTFLKKNKDKIIVLIDNFDYPYLHYCHEEDYKKTIEYAMKTCFAFIRSMDLKYSVAMCVVPVTYDIKFTHIDNAQKTKFYKSFGFTNLEVYLLLLLKQPEVSSKDLVEYIDLYGNYYFCSKTQSVHDKPVEWTHKVDENKESTYTEKYNRWREQSGFDTHCNPIGVLKKLQHSDIDLEEHLEGHPSIPLLAKACKSEHINWNFESLRSLGQYYTIENEFKAKFVSDLSTAKSVGTLLRYTGLSDFYLTGFDQSKILNTGNYMLQVPNETAKKIIQNKIFDNNNIQMVTSCFATAFYEGSVVKFLEGVKKVLSLSCEDHLPWNSMEYVYKGMLEVCFIHTNVTPYAEFSGAAVTPDFVLVPSSAKENQRMIFVIEVKRPSASGLETLRKQDGEKLKILKQSAVDGFNQCIEKKYTSVYQRLKNSYNCQKLGLLSIAFFRRDYFACFQELKITNNEVASPQENQYNIHSSLLCT